MMKPYFKGKTRSTKSMYILVKSHTPWGVYVNNNIDELHTTKVVIHTQSGCANRHRGGAEVSVSMYDIVW